MSKPQFLITFSSERRHGGRVVWHWKVESSTYGVVIAEGIETSKYLSRLRAKDAVREEELALSFSPTVEILTEKDL